MNALHAIHTCYPYMLCIHAVHTCYVYMLSSLILTTIGSSYCHYLILNVRTLSFTEVQYHGLRVHVSQDPYVLKVGSCLPSLETMVSLPFRSAHYWVGRDLDSEQIASISGRQGKRIWNLLLI